MKHWDDLGIDTQGKTSGQISTTCPQCSDSRHKSRVPCLSVNLTEGVWNCHHCGWSGSLTTGEDRQPQAPRAPRLYRKPAPLPSVIPGKIMQWFAARGIPESVIIRRSISYTSAKYFPQVNEERPAIMFPYFRNGELVNVKYRTSDKLFAMEGGAELILYGLDDIHGQTLLICEGEADAMALETAGFSSVVSVPNGAPALNTQHYEKQFQYLVSAEAIFAPLTKIILAVDSDPPGQKLAHELARRLGPERCCKVAWSSDCKDANDVLVSHGAAVLRECIEYAQPWPIQGIRTGEDLMSDMDNLYDNGMERGVSTGWGNVDKHYTVRTGEFTLVTGIPSHGKALSIETPIPTTTGWISMGDVQVGDTLLDDHGHPCRVTRVTDVMMHHRCYEVTFSDGATVIADAGHQWVTNSDKARRSARMAQKNDRLLPRDLRLRGNDQSHKRTFPSVITTEEIGETLLAGGKFNHAVALSMPIDLPEVSLPIPPYTLGIWLGDGTNACGQYSKPDAELVAYITADGYVVTNHKKPDSHGILGLTTQLRHNGLLHNKHIPSIYLRASIQQRMGLLQGLLDTDGSITPYGRVEFCTTTEALAHGTFELIASLGFRPVMITDRARLNGQDYGPRYRLTFTPDRPVFRLQRKRQLCKNASPKSTHRYIVAVKPVPSVPVKCIEVDSPSHMFLATKAFIPTHNSSWLDDLMIQMARAHGWAFSVFSPENCPLHRYAAALLEHYIGKPFDGSPYRMAKEEMRNGMVWLDDHVSFLLPEDASPTIDHLLDLAHIQVYRQGIKGLILDPWNEMEHSRQAGLTETEYISQVLSKIRRFARTHDVHVWIVAHPTKLRKAESGEYAGDYPPPTPYDVSGSAHFRNKADNCITIWRNLEADNNLVEVHFQKIRFREIGKPGMVNLIYDPTCGQFREPHL